MCLKVSCRRPSKPKILKNITGFGFTVTIGCAWFLFGPEGCAYSELLRHRIFSFEHSKCADRINHEGILLGVFLLVAGVNYFMETMRTVLVGAGSECGAVLDDAIDVTDGFKLTEFANGRL